VEHALINDEQRIEYETAWRLAKPIVRQEVMFRAPIEEGRMTLGERAEARRKVEQAIH
jgi:hypothetical protein